MIFLQTTKEIIIDSNSENRFNSDDGVINIVVVVLNVEAKME